MNHTLRPWTAADEPLTQRLVQELMGPVLTEAWGEIYAGAALMEMVRFIKEDEGETYVVEVEGRPVGLLGFTVDGETMHLSTLLVDASVQGQGLGKELLAFAYEKAQIRRAETIEAWVQENNQRARRFLEKNGFTFKEVAALGTIEMVRAVEPLPF